MTSNVRLKIVGTELFIAALNIVIGILLGVTAAGRQLPPSSDSVALIVSWTTAFAAELWWAGMVVAIVTAVLLAASDRSRVGMWTMAVIVAVGMVALIWAIVTILPVGAMSIIVTGMAAGTAVNRFLFGVVRPIPAARIRREQTDGYIHF